MQFLCNFLVWVAREQMNSLCLHGTLSSYFPRAEKDLVFSSTSTILPRTPEWAGMTSLVLSSLSVYVSLTAWPEISCVSLGTSLPGELRKTHRPQNPHT